MNSNLPDMAAYYYCIVVVEYYYFASHLLHPLDTSVLAPAEQGEVVGETETA